MKDPYQCICCGYTTQQKICMSRHLYNKKKPCPKSRNNIELTDEIKRIILTDRVYKIPVEQPPVTINQVVNYNNTIQNLITNMDVIDKLNKYITHHDVQLIEFGDTIEHKFEKQVDGLKHPNDQLGAYDSLILDGSNILEVIDQVSSLAQEHCENMNVIYDKKFDKLKLFDMGTWNDLILIKGITTLIAKIQEHYFNIYECYLIRKIESSTLCFQDKIIIKQQLSEYYRFIGCFELEPYVKDKNDSQVTYNEDDSRWDSCEDLTDENTEMPLRYLNLFNKVSGETNNSQCNLIKKGGH